MKECNKKVANTFSSNDIDLVKHVEEKFCYGHPYTSLIRLVNRGYKTNEREQGHIKKYLTGLLDIAKREEAIKAAEAAAIANKPKCFKIDFTAIKAVAYIANLDANIDDISIGNKPGFDFLNSFKTEDIPKTTLDRLMTLCNKYLNEFNNVKNLEQEYKDSYSFKVLDAIKYLEFLKKDIQIQIDIKINRSKAKVTVNKKVDPASLTKNFKYCIEGSVFKEKLIGSKNVIAYNKKYKVIFFYKAKDSDGMTVKGGSIANWNPETSYARRIGYKVKDATAFVEQIKKMNLAQFHTYIQNADKEKLFTDSVPKPNGSFNTDTQIIAIIN